MKNIKIPKAKIDKGFYDPKKIKQEMKNAFNQDDREIFVKNIKELARK